MKRSGIVIGAWTFLALIVIPLYPHFVSPNELTRWALVAAAVESRTIEVSSTARILGPRFEDLAIVDGRVYSNKAPGAALASAPGYLLARPFYGPPSAGSIRPVANAMRVVASTLPTALLALLFVAIARRAGVDDARSAGVVWILLFATPIFVYGLLLFSHALVSACLFGSWALLFFFPPSRRNDFVAGALIGLAVSSEYTMIFPAIAIGVALLLQRRWSCVARVAAAGLPFAVLLAAYHHAAFGSVLRTPYFYEKLPEYREVARSGFFGLHVPSPSTFARLLFDPTRGLLVFSPVLLAAIPAYRAAKRHMQPAAWWTLLAIPATILLVYSGYPNWHGGWNVGPRYIVAAIPFVVVTLLFRNDGLFESLLAGFSALAVILTSLVFPFPPNAFPFPWMSLAAPLALDGLIIPNIFHLIARPAAFAIPIVLIVTATVAAHRRRATLALLCGALGALIVGAQWWRIGDVDMVNLQRSYIADVYFEQRGALGEAPVGLLRRRESELRQPPASWPF
ncbi:MAG TPA: hypothetical protein VFM36_16770 [Thermoanaerobaculia bacterium]|nr:hypothetical protein [Thermoanaerobaculia bacterium]